MKTFLTLALSAVLLLGATASAETLTGHATGFGGELTVEVTMEEGTITGVEVTSHSETAGISDPALDQVPQAIVETNNEGVDTVSGATVTSTAIIAAVNNAVNPDAYPYEPEADEEAAPVEADAYFGLGMDSMARLGPGSDETETPVYSFNQVVASAIFDADGRILDLYVDQLEVATPNYDGAGMPHFSGFPGQGGYNWDENHDGTITGKTADTEENFTEEVASWQSKRARGKDYVMGTGTWAQQMDAFEALFTGMTVSEIEDWFAAYTSDRNGRPLKEGSENEEDAAKWDALSDEDKAMLADVTTSATMSLNDSHGNIIAAIQNAYDSRVPLGVAIAE